MSRRYIFAPVGLDLRDRKQIPCAPTPRWKVKTEASAYAGPLAGTILLGMGHHKNHRIAGGARVDNAAAKAHLALIMRQTAWDSAVRPLIERATQAALAGDLATFAALDAEVKSHGPRPAEELDA